VCQSIQDGRAKLFRLARRFGAALLFKRLDSFKSAGNEGSDGIDHQRVQVIA
jgi:hypothetical protein